MTALTGVGTRIARMESRGGPEWLSRPRGNTRRTAVNCFEEERDVSESMAEEIKRLQREIAERQMRLQFLVCGDQREGVSAQSAVDFEQMRSLDALRGQGSGA